MLRIVLGGGIASGKSTASAVLRELGADVMSLDDVAREVRERPEIVSALTGEYGCGILDADGRVSPAALAEAAFASDESAERLNSICHPAIIAEAERFFREPSQAPKVVEVPLITSTPTLLDMADEVLVIASPRDAKLSRAVARGMDEADARRRMERQADDSQLVSLASAVICNDSTVERLRERVARWYGEAIARS